MNLHVEPREGGNLAFFLNGDLQFDTRDEALYHESLALPPLCLTKASRVLICGGGDGLALREVLRFPGVTHVDLVDYSPETVALGKTEFSPYNADAFYDPRVTVHLEDAWAFLGRCEQRYDVVLCDFTVPRNEDEARIFSQEWFVQVRRVLTPNGVAAINACSPQRTPEAFWTLQRTIQSAQLFAVPYHVPLASFQEAGYGLWGFILASPMPLRRATLKDLTCPVATRQANLTRLWHAARFTKEERRFGRTAPIHTLETPCYAAQLLNPGQRTQTPPATLFDRLIRLVPVFHPHHTRTMVESMASQILGRVHDLDLRRLVDALLERAERLPKALIAELEALKLSIQMPRFGEWSTRLFAVLALILTLANLVAPDNVYGKGSFGLGHASVSRGIGGGSFGRGSSGFSSMGRSVSAGKGSSFSSGTPGFTSSSRATGSFNRATAPGFTSGGRATGGGSFTSAGIPRGTFAPSDPITGSGFRTSYRQGRPADIFGTSYEPRIFIYHSYHPGYARSYASSGPAPQNVPTRFVADDDMFVLENGDVVITVGTKEFLVVSQGNVTLFGAGSPEPVQPLYADPVLFENIRARLQDQGDALTKELERRREWLAWVGWTGAIVPTVREDKEEVKSLEDLQRRLTLASERLGTPSNVAAPPLPSNEAADAVELFNNAGLLTDGRIALLNNTAQWVYVTPKTATPALQRVLSAVIEKLLLEFVGDKKELNDDLTQLELDKVSLDKDLADYTQLQNANGPSYEVDYGTDTMSASEAITRTQNDLAQNLKDTTAVKLELTKLIAQQERLRAAQLEFAAKRGG